MASEDGNGVDNGAVPRFSSRESLELEAALLEVELAFESSGPEEGRGTGGMAPSSRSTRRAAERFVVV